MSAGLIPSARRAAPLDEATTRDLVKEAVDEAKELARVELELATAEAKEELRHVQRAAIGIGIAIVAAVVVICLVAMAIVVSLGGSVVATLLVATGFLALAGVAGAIGRARLPKRIFSRTRSRLGRDVAQLKEHLA